MELERDIRLVPLLLQTIAALLVWLGAPLRTWKRYVGYTDEQRFLLERTLEAMAKRGIFLRYDGESDAIVELRLRMLERFIDDPRKAMRHLARVARRYGRIVRTCLGEAAPDVTPRALVFAAIVDVEVCPDDSS